MSRSHFVFAGVLAFAVSASDVSAVQRGNGGGPKPKPVQSGPAVKPQSVKMQAPKGHTPKVQAPKVQGPKAHAPKTHTQKARSASHGPKTKTSGGAAAKTSTTEPTSSKRARTTSSGTLSPVQQKLQSNTKLAARLSNRLPGGTDVIKAAEGFRNLGQFVAAVNVSNNLGIPFTDLKTRMVDDGMSLGQAIKDARPSANATLESRRAVTAADAMIAESTASQPKPKRSKTTTTTARRTGSR